MQCLSECIFPPLIKIIQYVHALIRIKFTLDIEIHDVVYLLFEDLNVSPLSLIKQMYYSAPPLTAHTGITSTAWHPWRPARGLFWATLLLACKYPALTQRIICSKIKRRETQALGYVKLLSGTDNGKPTLAGRGNLSLQSVRLYVLIRDGALLAL